MKHSGLSFLLWISFGVFGFVSVSHSAGFEILDNPNASIPTAAYPNTLPHSGHIFLAAGNNPYLPNLDEGAGFNASNFNSSDFIIPECDNNYKATPEMQACMKYLATPRESLQNAYSAQFEECVKKAILKQTDPIKKQEKPQECEDIEDIETMQQFWDNKKIKNNFAASKYIMENQRFLAIHSYLVHTNAAEAENIKNLAIQRWIEREWIKENSGLPPSDVISKQKGIIKKNPIIEQLALVEYYKEQENQEDKAEQKNLENMPEIIEGLKRGR